jgi:hypothetical protein
VLCNFLRCASKNIPRPNISLESRAERWQLLEKFQPRVEWSERWGEQAVLASEGRRHRARCRRALASFGTRWNGGPNWQRTHGRIGHWNPMLYRFARNHRESGTVDITAGDNW